MPLGVEVEVDAHGKRTGRSAEGGRGGKWSFVAPLSLLSLLRPLVLPVLVLVLLREPCGVCVCVCGVELWVSFGEAQNDTRCRRRDRKEISECRALALCKGPLKHTTQTKARHTTTRTPSPEIGGGARGQGRVGGALVCVEVAQKMRHTCFAREARINSRNTRRQEGQKMCLGCLSLGAPASLTTTTLNTRSS